MAKVLIIGAGGVATVAAHMRTKSGCVLRNRHRLTH